MADGLTNLYQDLLTGSYDCVDRISLNGYFRMAHVPPGFKPLLAAAPQLQPTRGPQNPRPLDIHYQTIYAGMQGIFQELGIAA